MRLTALALVISLCAANPGAAEPASHRASVAEPLPAIPKNTPYPEARGRLILSGVDPVPVGPRPGHLAPCPYDTLFCQTYKEIVACGVGGWMQHCMFLFRRRSDGQLLIVHTSGEADTAVFPADFRGIRINGIEKATLDDIPYDAVIASGARKDRR
ncbi:hypothetical protein [Phenylobacterium sp.]|uniref:hypothetical protein n=1 Tax=Phenylobacterium sp. TaxID=1871053 RepID=UPI003D2E6C1B